MDQLTVTYKIAMLLLITMADYSCRGKSMNRSLVSDDDMDSIVTKCSSEYRIKFPQKKVFDNALVNVSCHSFVPGSICKTSNDPHMLSFDGLTFDGQMSGINWIHCGTRSSFWNLTGLSNSHIRTLDLSGIGLTYLPSGIFKMNFTSLQHLNLANNLIFGFDSLFSNNLLALHSVDLTSNRLTEVHFNWTISHPFLTFVNLSYNHLSYLLPSEPQNQSMIIDLSFNQLSCIDKPLEILLKTNITINLDGNPFTCECMQSLQNRIYDNCTCENPTQLLPFQSKSPGYIESCMEAIVYFKTQIFVGVAFLVGSLVTFIYMYRNRKNLCRCVRYPRDLNELVIQPSEKKAYDNHAYIVCDDKDHVILRKILQELEGKRQMKIVCDARDAPPTEFAIAYIEKCLSTSRRTVFVMSSNFLDNKLCLYVLKLAASVEYLEQKCVIIILKVKPFTKEQEKLQEKLTFGKIWYKYPSDDENDSFWNILAAAINDPKLQFQILGIHHSENTTMWCATEKNEWGPHKWVPSIKGCSRWNENWNKQCLLDTPHTNGQ